MVGTISERQTARMIRAIHNTIESLKAVDEDYWHDTIIELSVSLSRGGHEQCPGCGRCWPIGAIGHDGCPFCNWNLDTDDFYGGGGEC